MSPRPLWPEWPALQRRLAAAREVTVLLDYDGTLVPLADHPADARLPQRMRRLLEQLSRQPGVRVALVSGRSLRDLRRQVRLPGLGYVGNHGLELRDGTQRYVNAAAAKSRPYLRAIVRQLRRQLRPIRGAWVEDKGLTASVHYRLVRPIDLPHVQRIFYAVVQPYQIKRHVRVTTGRCVFEVRPPVSWSKATMVNWLLTRQQDDAGRRSLPLYVGDDVTDEDAFELLRSRGLTVAVAPAASGTRARYGVDTPEDVRRLLERVLVIRRNHVRRLPRR